MNNYFTATQQSNLENCIFSEKQLNEIRKKTPKSEIEIKKDEAGTEYKTVKAPYVKRKLNILFGWNYDFAIISKEYSSVSKETIVHGRLTIRTLKGTIIREQFGNAPVTIVKEKITSRQTFAPSDIGNAYKAATSDCLKKCASELGLFWDIYGLDKPEKIELTEPSPEDLLIYDEKLLLDRFRHFMRPTITTEQAEHVKDELFGLAEISPELIAIVENEYTTHINTLKS